MTQTVDETLNERGARYGTFDKQAEVTQELKRTIRCCLALRRKSLVDDQQEALDMICSKIARIVNGDADYHDNWHDIAGYARLIADRLEGKVR